MGVKMAAAPVEKERSVMDRVKAGEITLSEIVPVRVGAPERASEFVAPEERAAAPAAEKRGRRAAREEEKPEMEEAPAPGEEAPAQEEGKPVRNLAMEKPVKSDNFDIAFEEEAAPERKGAGKKKKGDEEDFLF